MNQCEYPDCKEKATTSYAGLPICYFHWRIKRLARSNLMKRKSKERKEREVLL